MSFLIIIINRLCIIIIGTKNKTSFLFLVAKEKLVFLINFYVMMVNFVAAPKNKNK